MADLSVPRRRTAAASPVDLAKSIILAHRQRQTPPGDALAWVAAGLGMHLHVGIALPLALGLPGFEEGNDAVDRRRQRDRLLREVARRWFPGLCPAQAAVAIAAAIARQARARGRVTDELSGALEALWRFDPPVPKGRQLRRIVAMNPIEMATADR